MVINSYKYGKWFVIFGGLIGRVKR